MEDLFIYDHITSYIHLNEKKALKKLYTIHLLRHLPIMLDGTVEYIDSTSVEG